MRFETLKKSHTKEIAIGAVVLILIVSVVVFKTTRAKYKTTQSINILNGTINYKPYDFKVLAMYNQKEGSNCTEDSCYEEITGRMPSSGYVINEDKSYCTLDGTNKDTEAKLKTINGEHVIRNLKKNEKCKLYFDKIKVTNIQELIANSHINIGSPNFSNTAKTDEGIYQASDGMYGGTSYYWRGAATSNHVIFANKCWRIVRINGDGSIRLIYNGPVLDENTCFGNGVNAGSIAKTGIKYNTSYNNSSYVGWTYIVGSQSPKEATSGTEEQSNIRTETESWYKTEIVDKKKGYEDKVADGKFCNDRRTKDNAKWIQNGSTTQFYASYQRLFEGTKTPTLACNSNDIYTLKVGLITADEVQFAGASAVTYNTGYYLYNGQYYWTMSPYHWDSSGNARGLYVDGTDGSFGWTTVNNATLGVRPVINLKSDTVFATGGEGTKDKPYVVND